MTLSYGARAARRPPPPEPMHRVLVRWARRFPRLAKVTYWLVTLGLLIGLFGVGFVLGPAAPGLFVAALTWIVVGIGLRRSPLRHNLRFWFRWKDRRAYRAAGAPDLLTAGLLWASGVGPADVRALSSLGLDRGSLESVGHILADHHERSERLALDVLAASAPGFREDTLRLLSQILDLDAAPEMVLAYWVDHDVAPGVAVRLLAAGVPLTLYRAMRHIPDFHPVVPWLEGLWPPLAAVDCDPQVLLTWARERPEFVTGHAPEVFARQQGERLADWWTSGAGIDAPWWADAGFAPKDAGKAIAAGNRRDRVTLTGYAALLHAGPLQSDEAK